MNTYYSSNSRRFGIVTDVLLLVLLVVSLLQVAACVSAGRLLIAPSASPAARVAPMLGTNAPAPQAAAADPAVKSAGFSSEAARG